MGTPGSDLAFSCGGSPWFMEVKGVTLDMDGTAMFPDAPTERGIRHLEGLAQAVKDGIRSGRSFCDPDEGAFMLFPPPGTPPGICRCTEAGEGKRRPYLGL